MSAMDTDYVEEEVAVENPTLKAAYNQPPLHHNQPLKWDYELNMSTSRKCSVISLFNPFGCPGSPAEVDLIGEKIYDKVIHLCEICELPILVYGRMLPCKHIFCFDCARKCEKSCKRCAMRVQKVEKSALGTVYVCTHGAAKHSTKGCRRTYLSQRDLQSHIAHRHVPKPISETKVTATATTVAQPSGPQLPLTQQQAALQQASQPVSHSPTVSLPSLSVQSAVPPLLVPSLGDLTSPQATQPPHPGTLTPSRIPGLGEMQPRSSASPIVRQASPALPPDMNPNPMGLGMNFNNLQPQMSSDQGIYRPLDMVPMSQHQQQQQPPPQHMMGMPGSHMPRGPVPKSMPRFGEPLQLPVSGALMQSMNSQQMPRVGQPSPSMHMTAQMHHQQQHQQQLLPEQQLRQEHQHHALREQHLLQEHQQQRMNMSHHESVSKMPSAMLSSSSSHPGPQSQANLDSFGSSPGSYESLQAGPGRTNVNLITVPIQDEGPYPPMSMVGQSQGNSHPFSPTRPSMSQNFPPQEGTQGMNRSNFPHMGNKSPNMGAGIPSTQPLPFSQPPGNNPRMNNAMAVNPRTGLNNLQASAIVEMFQALARPQGGTGLMPIPRANNQGLMNPRFNPANWTAGGNPRSIQPRMSQNQQRPPRGEGQFKPNYFG